MAASTDFYVALLTSEHKDQPQFQGVVRLLTQALADGIDLGYSLIDAFDLDQAQGAQLDAIGLWVGISRGVAVPITGAYFTWDGAASVGWEAGYWQGPLDPSTGIVSLSDDIYISLIRAKIAANSWDGTLGTLVGLWDYIFGPGVIIVQDNQDMTVTIIYDPLQLNTVQTSLLTNGHFPLKPAAVRYIYVAGPAAPIFSWDYNTPKFKGWDVGSWI